MLINNKLPIYLAALCAGISVPFSAKAADTNQAVTLPPVTVTGGQTLLENLPLGENMQPEWTAHRRFATTRVYVQPPWQVEVEVGLDSNYPRHGGPEHLLTEEFELGLPHRFQLDFENHDQNFVEGVGATNWHHNGNTVELGYAFADWGAAPLNPTIKGEWNFQHEGADIYEIQLLLGQELAERWHWGMNLFFEKKIGDDYHEELAMSQAISYTVIDDKFSVGAEMKIGQESDFDTRGTPEHHFELGPSIQWRPTARTHLDVVPLFGMGTSSPQAEVLILFGFEFGKGSKDNENLVPASFRGK